MSGPSTLRICLAAMAPALTEAASARIKLQETSKKDSQISRVVNGDQQNGELLISKFSCNKHITGDLNVLGGQHGSNADRRVASVSSGSTERHNGTPVDPESGSALTAIGEKNFHFIVPASKVKPGPLHVKEKHITNIDLHVPEDFQECSLLSLKERDQLIERQKLKIMSQTQSAAEKQIELSKILESASSKLQIGGKPSSNSLSVMVNGDDDLNGSKEKESVGERSNIRETDVSLRAFGVLEGLQSKVLNSNTTRDLVSTNPSSKMGCVPDGKALQIVDEASKLVEQDIVNQKLNEEMRKECVKKQAHLERKVDILIRRLKRINGKVVESHTREQLRQFVNFQHKNLQMVAKTIKKETPGPEELKEHFLSNEEVKNMSTAQLVKLVKSCQSSKFNLSQGEGCVPSTSSSAVLMDNKLRAQSLKTAERLEHRAHIACAELDSDATASSSGGESGDEDTAPSPKPSAETQLPSLLRRADWKWAVDRAAVVARWTWLQAQVSDLEYRIRQQSQVCRQLRNNKGGVVLGDAPTATEMFRRLQVPPVSQHGVDTSNSGTDGKLAVESVSPAEGTTTEVSPLNVSAVLSNIDKQASRLTQCLGNCLSPTSSNRGSPAGSKLPSPQTNGITDSPAGSTSTAGTDTLDNSPATSVLPPADLKLTERFSDLLSTASSTAAADASCQAARCRPLRSYRKRKMLRTIGLYKTSSKACKLSDLGCHCDLRVTNPCAICGGRYNNTQTVDADYMSMPDRVALLDPSFHPVLSFPEDVRLPLHCEGLLKSGLWQNRPLPRRSRGDCHHKRHSKVIRMVSEPVVKKTGSNNTVNKKQDNGKNNSTATVIDFSTKIKNKYDSKTKVKKSTSSKGTSVKPKISKAKRKAAKLARENLKKIGEDEDGLEDEYLNAELLCTPSGQQGDGLSQSAPASTMKDQLREGQHQRKRKVDNSYDINNIVIPLSMATSTRVEQLQYKEIVTPKWREVPGLNTSSTVDSETLTQKLEKTNGVSVSGDNHKLQTVAKIEEEEEEEEEEDLSDEKFLARHAKQEMEERKRFRNFIQYNPSRRGRARSEAYTEPKMISEEPNGLKTGALGEGGDASNSGVASAADGDGSRPATPMLNRSLSISQNQEDSLDSLQHQLAARRRAPSFSRRAERSSSIFGEDSMTGHLPSSRIEPWPLRIFPLSEEEYEAMRHETASSCEPVHPPPRASRRLANESSGRVWVGLGGQGEQQDESIPCSAAPSPHPSNDSISSAGDDPNDPEWVGGGDSVSSSRKHKHQRKMMNDDPTDPEWTGSDTIRRGKNKR